MDKLKMHSANKVDEHIASIRALFPNCVTERKGKDGETQYAIDFDMLRQELSDVIVEGKEERYQFTWPDKRKSVLAANAPIAATLRPCREESVDFDTTENLYIDGDNLDVLKLLQETYMGKIKLIYIDPPYNTGSDFVYADDFSENVDEYLADSGQFDAQGNRLAQNTESEGRFHTNWLNMIYPRLKLAKELLSDDGVVFISVDDHEQENLKKLCDEIFGEFNFLAQIVWERAFSPVNLKKHFSESHDYIICYAKNIDSARCNGLPRNNEANNRYSNPDNDPRGPWTSGDLSVGPRVESKVYEITVPSGRKVLPPSGYCWRLDKETFEAYKKDNRIWFGEDGNNVPRIKRFLSEVKQGITPMTIWKYTEVGHSQDASQKLKKLFDSKAFFDYPKPVDLIKRCIQLYTEKEDFVLDFFSGSATTAHAVMQLNAEDGGHRRYILVQLPEATDEKSEAYKAGYKTICEIGKERIRRAGKRIKSEWQIGSGFEQLDMDSAHWQTEIMEAGEPAVKDLDIGFRVLKLDSSNMKDVYYTPAKTTRTLFESLADNIKEDRTPEDLLFQVMLDLGILLSSKIEERTIAGKRVFSVNDDYLLACFDNDLTDEVIEEMASLHPYYVVTRDSSMASDSVKTSFEQILLSHGIKSNEWKVL